MTTPQTPVDAHLMLVQNLAHVVAQDLPWQSAYDAVEASARALAAIPECTCPAKEMAFGRCCKLAPKAPAQDAQGVDSIRRLVADDSYAMSFQTMGQYRTALLKALAALRASSPAEQAVNQSLTTERPPYCGSGHCSCIECHFPVTKEST